MSTPTPFTFSGTLKYPPDTGEAAANRSFSLSSSFTQNAEFTYVLSGSGTQVVNFGSLTASGARAILVEVDPDSDPSAAPVNLTFNSGSDDVEISPGGFFALASPNPSSGILAMSIAHTSAVCVRVRILG